MASEAIVEEQSQVSPHRTDQLWKFPVITIVFFVCLLVCFQIVSLGLHYGPCGVEAVFMTSVSHIGSNEIQTINVLF